MRVLIVGLDTFARKNKLQIELAHEKNYFFDIICNDTRGESHMEFGEFVEKGSRLFCNNKGNLAKIILFLRMMLRNKYQHVELYPGGRLGFFYALVLWLTRTRFLVIERGDIGCMKDYSLLVQLSLILSYKLSSGVIYKETYMKERLRNFGAKKLYFLPNCVNEVSSDKLLSITERKGFLWVNRIIKQRRASWLVNSFNSSELNREALDVVGFKGLGIDLDEMPILERDLKESKAELTSLHKLQGPFDFYKKRRFFCLPSEIVFGNNSLLEAMSHGLIPIVTRSPGIELLITDGENGIITDFTEVSYRKGLVKAAKMTPAEVERMSASALETIREKFSTQQWINKLESIYTEK